MSSFQLLDPAGQETLIHQQNNRAIEGAESRLATAETEIDALQAIVPLDSYSANCNSTTALTTTAADVPGATVTLVDQGTYLIIASFDFAPGLGTGKATGSLVVDGSTETGTVDCDESAGQANVARAWIVTTSGASKVAKLQALKTINAGTANVVATDTNIVAVRIA